MERTAAETWRGGAAETWGGGAAETWREGTAEIVENNVHVSYHEQRTELL